MARMDEKLVEAYVGGYFMCQIELVRGDLAKRRCYATTWHCRLFSVAAKVEAKITGLAIHLGVSDRPDRFDLDKNLPPSEIPTPSSP